MSNKCLLKIVAISLLAICVQPSRSQDILPTDPISICGYPLAPKREPFPSLDPTRLETVSETEPNSQPGAAEAVPLGIGDGLDHDVDINGEITPFDRDFFSFQASKGQTIGVAVLAIDADLLNSRVSIHNDDGDELLLNEDHALGGVAIADLYPPESPFPAGGANSRDSLLTFAFPEDGTYFVRIAGFGASRGAYLAQLRLREPPMWLHPSGTQQMSAGG